MIISEKQIFQLITIARNFMAIICASQGHDAKTVKAYNQMVELLDIICNQQSEELKVIE